MKNGGTFTKSMGEAICDNVRMKIKGYGQASKKNGEKLVLIIGNSMVFYIGILLALCEAHRQSTKHKNAITTQLITRYATRIKQHRKLFGKEYDEIFKGQTFGNICASATQLKKIQDSGDLMGLYRASVLRGHKVAYGKISNTTANVYVAHAYNSEDKNVRRITLSLFERGVCSAAPYMLLCHLDKNFAELDCEDQTDQMNDLGLSALDVETLSETVLKQKSIVNDIFHQMIKSESKEIMINALNLISTGQPVSKHQFSRCFLKALLYSGATLKDKKILNGCLYPEAGTCFGCDYLIAEKYFLHELNDKMMEILLEAKGITSHRDIQRYSKIIKTLKNILKQAFIILGSDVVKALIDTEKLINQLKLTEKYIENQQLHQVK